MKKRIKSHDFNLAYEVYQQENCFGLTENAIIPKNIDKENYKPRTLIDQTLELIDPTPNIYTLFMQFNERFFWNVLLPVEVKWSSRMTSCAGVCTFHSRNRQCVISLSAPLLKLRPRKDLVETLLHEMIHGYLFLTNNNRDRDGHGPEFCKHMNRINNIAGTKITIYHSFHDEVKLYQQHWWRCNGPCQKRAPYFGTVRRAMNRPPGPSDFWWKEHKLNCNGQFIKIKEPENFKAKGSKNKDKEKSTPESHGSPNNILNWLNGKPISSITDKSFTSTPKNVKSISNIQGLQNGLKKLGNNTNNVHGWGTGGPGSSNYSIKNTSVCSTQFSSSGTIGGSNTGKSNLLDKFSNNKKYFESDVNIQVLDKTINTFINGKLEKSSNSIKEIKLVECPVCDNFISNNDLSKHVDLCLTTRDKQSTCKVSISKIQPKEGDFMLSRKRKIDMDTSLNKQPKLDKSRLIDCPVCNRSFVLNDINEHLDKCLSETDVDDTNPSKSNSIISVSSSPSENLSSSVIDDLDIYRVTNSNLNQVTKTNDFKCLVCNVFIPPEISLKDHLEDCIGSVFNDDSTDFDNKRTADTVLEISSNQTDKYPCPVCMELILEFSMNQHLDLCLKST
nr:sprT-like domain-containing protein Spartan [Megalopta genalis]